jgi:hypothetical protein
MLMHMMSCSSFSASNTRGVTSRNASSSSRSIILLICNNQAKPLDIRTTSATRPHWRRIKSPQQRKKFYCIFHGEDLGHPTIDCPKTKEIKDRMARAVPTNNQRDIAHTYEPHLYPHPHYQNEHPYYPQHQQNYNHAFPSNRAFSTKKD